MTAPGIWTNIVLFVKRSPPSGEVVQQKICIRKFCEVGSFDVRHVWHIILGGSQKLEKLQPHFVGFVPTIKREYLSSLSTYNQHIMDRVRLNFWWHHCCLLVQLYKAKTGFFGCLKYKRKFRRSCKTVKIPLWGHWSPKRPSGGYFWLLCPIPGWIKNEFLQLPVCKILLVVHWREMHQDCSCSEIPSFCCSATSPLSRDIWNTALGECLLECWSPINQNIANFSRTLLVKS